MSFILKIISHYIFIMICYNLPGASELIHWIRNKMDDIWQPPTLTIPSTDQSFNAWVVLHAKSIENLVRHATKLFIICDNMESNPISQSHHWNCDKQHCINVYLNYSVTHVQLEMLGCILSTAASDALVLKHQAIIICRPEQVIIVLDQIQMKISHVQKTAPHLKQK